MKIEEAIQILERKTTIPGDGCTWEQIEEAIDAAVTALRSMLEAGESLTMQQLRKVSHEKIKDSTLQNIANRANEIASPPAHIDRSEWTAEWIYPENEWNLPRCSKCGCNSKDATYGHKDNFCPKCGRAMTPEAWAELERRLRG